MSRKSPAVIRTRSTWSSAVQVAVRTPGGASGADLGEVRQQADLAEVAAGPDVVQDVLAAGPALRDLHEPGPDEVEAVVGRGPLAEDHLAGLAAAELHLLA